MCATRLRGGGVVAQSESEGLLIDLLKTFKFIVFFGVLGKEIVHFTEMPEVAEYGQNLVLWNVRLTLFKYQRIPSVLPRKRIGQGAFQNQRPALRNFLLCDSYVDFFKPR